MSTSLSQFQSHQLEVIARVTPHAMCGHLLNTTVLAIAVAGSVPKTQLIGWCIYSYAIACILLYRHVRGRGRIPRNFARAVRRATAYAFFLALPWAWMGALYMGTLAHDEELILVALVVGMTASGTILLSAIPVAAFSYMSGILLPGAVKCLVFLNQKGYVLLGVLALSYWWFLAALIAKITREISERKEADIALKESEARLQQALAGGQVVAFTWDLTRGRSQRSENVVQILGLEPQVVDQRHPSDFLKHVHPEDRHYFITQIKGLCPEKPSYSSSFRFIRPDGREMWLEETGTAEFDATGRHLRIKGLTRDSTERKRSEERQRLLVRELDHRVKNVLASVATIAQRTREGSTSIDEFLQTFDGRIQSLANAHALLSRSHWEGVNLAKLVCSELAPCVGEGTASIEGPEVLLTAEATQAIAIVLHELVTNASKYGALSTPLGRITVRWDWRGAKEGLSLEWTEANGPAVAVPSQTGYGIRAIRRLIPHELGGTVDLTFETSGLRCRIELPSECILSDRQPTTSLKVLEAAPSSASGSSVGPRQ
jgi:PAS domain S-box-containing protein